MTEEERLRHGTFIAGMIAARGDWRTCFRGKNQQRLVSSISFGSRDMALVEMIRGHIGKGTIREKPTTQGPSFHRWELYGPGALDTLLRLMPRLPLEAGTTLESMEQTIKRAEESGLWVDQRAV